MMINKETFEAMQNLVLNELVREEETLLTVWKTVVDLNSYWKKYTDLGGKNEFSNFSYDDYLLALNYTDYNITPETAIWYNIAHTIKNLEMGGHDEESILNLIKGILSLSTTMIVHIHQNNLQKLLDKANGIDDSNGSE